MEIYGVAGSGRCAHAKFRPMKTTFFSGCFGLIFQACSLLASTAPARSAPGDAALAQYFAAETSQLSERCLADASTLNAWKAQRERNRQQLFEMLGLSPLPNRTPLHAVVTGTVEQDSFKVEKLHFQSAPGLYVTANLYFPKRSGQPAPTILYLSGHGPVIKNGISYGNKVAYQHHGAWFARHGYVCLILDTLQLGEIQGLHHGTYREGMWWWNSRGYTPAGVEAWNSIRALDYLSTRAEVDTNRFGVTGRSGGGAYSWWLAALDERIKVAAPVAGITDLRNHVVDGTVEGHCDCMFMVNTYRWDYPQVAALVAPRPLLIVNTDDDSIFPLDGVVRLHRKVRSIYQLYGANAKLGLVIAPGPHADTQDLQLPVFRWFNRHLKGEDALIEAAATNYFQPEQLRVFAALPTDQMNTNIHAIFVPKANPLAPAAAAKQQAALVAELSTKAFGGWPEVAAPLKLEKRFSASRHGLKLQAYDFDSQPHVRLRLYLLGAANSARARGIRLLVSSSRPAATQASGAETSNTPCLSWEQWLKILEQDFAVELAEDLAIAKASPDWPTREPPVQFNSLKSLLQSNRLVLALVAPRGMGLTAWDPDPKRQVQIRRRFMLLGQTLDGMRVWDIRRAAEAIRSIQGPRDIPLRVQARGFMAANALYASLFEPTIAGLDLWDLPSSQTEGPDYLNVLRILDLPETLAMATERMPVRLQRTEP